ncbi:Flagellar biosynthetic protein FliP [Buchnera aphidicola (Pterocallis alni)]
MLMKLFIFFVLLMHSVNVNASELPNFLSYSILNNINMYTLFHQKIFFIVFLSFFPVLILLTTSFTRIIIILSLLRNALGIPYLPPNQILFSMSIFLTFFIMSPTIDKIYKESYLPLHENKIQINEAVIKGIKPMHDFMLHQTRKSDLLLFYNLSHIKNTCYKNNVPLIILIPAFITSELKTAFQIGFTIFIPFLIIDLVVSSVLIALGMMMVPPSTVALPFKLILFVLIDGWKLIFSSLVESFY